MRPKEKEKNSSMERVTEKERVTGGARRLLTNSGVTERIKIDLGLGFRL